MAFVPATVLLPAVPVNIAREYVFLLHGLLGAGAARLSLPRSLQRAGCPGANPRQDQAGKEVIGMMAGGVHACALALTGLLV